jgi:lysophospholipid acyltransferase (LPLAT)-like uncharacterized protein
MNKLMFKLEAILGAALMRALKASIRWNVVNQNPPSQRCVYFFWHRNLLILGLQRAGTRAAVLVSASKDGELIAGPLEKLGYIPVRGSSSRHGSQALKEMVRLAKKMTVALTPDGPKGPAGSIHPGVFQIALLARVPIIVIVPEAKNEWVFRSWDRFRFPKPFTRIKVLYSDPFWVRSKDDFSIAEQGIRAFIEKTETELRQEIKHEQSPSTGK